MSLTTMVAVIFIYNKNVGYIEEPPQDQPLPDFYFLYRACITYILQLQHA